MNDNWKILFEQRVVKVVAASVKISEVSFDEGIVKFCFPTLYPCEVVITYQGNKVIYEVDLDLNVRIKESFGHITGYDKCWEMVDSLLTQYCRMLTASNCSVK